MAIAIHASWGRVTLLNAKASGSVFRDRCIGVGKPDALSDIILRSVYALALSYVLRLRVTS